MKTVMRLPWVAISLILVFIVLIFLIFWQKNKTTTLKDELIKTTPLPTLAQNTNLQANDMFSKFRNRQADFEGRVVEVSQDSLKILTNNITRSFAISQQTQFVEIENTPSPDQPYRQIIRFVDFNYLQNNQYIKLHLLEDNTAGLVEVIKE